MVRCVSNTTTAVPRTSKTKAIHDAAWRSLKPRTFSRVKTALKPKTHSNPKKSSPVSGPVVRHQKKRKVSSNKGWSNSSFVLRADTNVTSNTVQLSFAYGKDVPEDEPRRHVPSRPSIEDQFPVSDLPPDLARRKRVTDPVDDESVLSQSDGSKTLDSQDYESEDGQEDLRHLNGNELVRSFDDEVCISRLTQYDNTTTLGCSMDATGFAISPASSTQQWWCQGQQRSLRV